MSNDDSTGSGSARGRGRGRGRVSTDPEQYSSRKKGRLSAISSGQEVEDLTVDDEHTDTNFWRKKHDAVFQEHERVKSELEAQLSISGEREAQLEKLTTMLETKVKSLEERNARNAASSSLLDFFEKMTSMQVKLGDGGASTGPQSFVCTVRNAVKRQATRFRIENTASNEVSFLPMANLEMLPEYLRAHISFEPDMCPVVMGDILQNLYEDSTNEI